jgi:hypothetical protein
VTTNSDDDREAVEFFSRRSRTLRDGISSSMAGEDAVDVLSACLMVISFALAALPEWMRTQLFAHIRRGLPGILEKANCIAAERDEDGEHPAHH